MQEQILDALRRNAPQDAVALATQWVQESPGQAAQGYRLLALAQQYLGQLEQAHASLEQSLALDPEDAASHLQHAGLLVALRRMEDADLALARTTDLNPNAFTAYIMQAHLALARHDIDEADRLSRMAARIEPDSAELAAVAGAVLLRRGDVDAALPLLSSAAQQLPDDPRVLYALGFAYLGKDMPAFAEQSFRRVLERTPGNRPLQGLVIDLALRQGNLDGAAEMLQQVRAAGDDDNVGMRRLAARIELGRGQPLLAAELLEPLLPAHPADRALLQLLLTAWSRLGTVDRARAVLDGVLDGSPQVHEPWLARLALEPIGGDEAAAVADRWVAAMPEHIPALETRLRIHDMQDQPEDAEAMARRIIALSPGRAGAEERLVDGLLKRDPAAAVAHVQALIERADETARPGLRAWLGKVQDSAGFHADALATWVGLHASLAPQRLPLPPQAKAPATWPEMGTVAEDNTIAPMLLWGAPGSGVERVVAGMSVRSNVLRGDRFGPNPPTDAFQSYNTLQDLASGKLAPEALIEGWRAALPARGIPDGNVIDWLLWWDNALLWALRPQLPQGRLVVALRDPRDMLLEWLAIGGVAPFGVTSANEAAEWLARSMSQIALLHEESLYPHVLLRIDEIDNDAAKMATLLEQTFQVEFPPAATLGPSRMAPGHWRAYRDLMGPALDKLTPVAVRLGYPKD